MQQYEVRSYRSWIEDKDLVSVEAKIAESDLFIRAEKELCSQSLDSLRKQRKLIEDYIRQDPQFATTLEPYSAEDGAPEIIRAMADASSEAGVGPMAAVAGAIAEYVGKDLLIDSSEVIVENGGDIFMHTARTRWVGIFAGKSSLTGRLSLEITPGTWGICTSSATVGPSLSFGQADAAVVVCKSAILADAWATRLGNMVKSAEDIDQTLEFVKSKPEIRGVVIIVGDRLGVCGEMKLRRS